MTGYNFTKRAAERIAKAVRTVESMSRTTPANHRKYRSIRTNCGYVRRLFVPPPDEYEPNSDVVAVIPKWNVEDVGGTMTVTTCGYEEVKECPAAAPLQTVFDTEADLVTEHDPTELPSGSVFYVTDETATDDNRPADMYVVQGPVGDVGVGFLRVGGLTPTEEEQLAFWVVNQ